MPEAGVWAKSKWSEDLQHKLRQGELPPIQWWNIAKAQQGLSKDDLIPPLNQAEGNVVYRLQDKLELFT